MIKINKTIDIQFNMCIIYLYISSLDDANSTRTRSYWCAGDHKYISTSIHDDPASIIAHFEILLDEELLLMNFSEMQSNLLHTIAILNTLEM